MRERVFRNRNLLPEADNRPAVAGRSSVCLSGGPTPIHLDLSIPPSHGRDVSYERSRDQELALNARRSLIRTASTRFSRTDSTRIE
jgi:hypothetical protein